ncbi:MAG: hypothetical protein GEV09_12725 [Pseudonocardiaceae bacterium]|nr:hypothetical protein [Pseudonocardiaceae bacterium]
MTERFTVVYRAYDRFNLLLYVGITGNFVVRLSSHAEGSGSEWVGYVDWIEIKRYATRAEALAAEATAILDEDPAFNIRGRPREQSEQAFRDWLHRHSALTGHNPPGAGWWQDTEEVIGGPRECEAAA